MTTIVEVLESNFKLRVDDVAFMIRSIVRQFFFGQRTVIVSTMGDSPSRGLLLYVQDLKGDEFSMVRKLLEGTSCPHGAQCNLMAHVREITCEPGGVPT